MDRTTPEAAVLQAAHVVAHGGELDRKLDALAEEARLAAEASAAAIYVLDPLASTLVAAAAAGLDLAGLAEGGVVGLDHGEAFVARAVRERRRAAGDGSSKGAVPGSTGFRHAIAMPLVYADEAGAEEPEGALLVAYDGQSQPGADTEKALAALAALADLCAVAIRQARLEHTLQERAEWMSRVATSDALTGLPNKAIFEQMLELELARSSRQKTELSIVLFDVDGMTAINDEHGADVGDDVLRTTASLLAEQIRVVDGVARTGADEFGLVAPSGGGAVVARRIRDAAYRVSLPSGAQLSLSAAVVVFPHDGATAAELLSRAAEVLEEAKGTGPGTVVATRELQT